ncbi:MAG: menaquinone biosynthesis decarboxylase [Candidatus Baltobacteraceae bacterium]
MVFDSLGQFVRALRRAGELVDVDVRVDPRLEIAEITDRIAKAGGPALLFRNVAGSSYPVLTNQFGSERRMTMAFGARSLEEVAGRVRAAVDMRVPRGSMARFAKLIALGSIATALPRTVKDAPVQEVVERDPDLRTLPVLTTWPLDGGPFITLPLVFTKDPETGAQNVGMYRIQIYDTRTTGMHWQRHKQGRAHASKWGRRVPIAIAIGADPAITYAASAPLPPGIDEIAFAGFLRGRSVRMVRALTVDLKVPADAEFVLEGEVDNDDLRIEGPFGDHTGVYSLEDRYPTFHLHCITHRTKPIYAATVVGKPPMEDAWLGKATERIFLPLLQLVVPEIVDYNLPVEGGFHNLAIVAIRKSYPGQANKVMNALWGLGHMMMLTRTLLIVDEGVDVHDVRAVAWNALNNVDPSRDLVVMPGPVDDLDHSGSHLSALGHKLGIDATRKGPSEGYRRTWPPEIVMDARTRALVTNRWQEYGLQDVAFAPNAWSGQGEAALRTLLSSPPFVAPDGDDDDEPYRLKGTH